jgi:hypothetical protein
MSTAAPTIGATVALFDAVYEGVKLMDGEKLSEGGALGVCEIVPVEEPLDVRVPESLLLGVSEMVGEEEGEGTLPAKVNQIEQNPPSQ